MPRARNYGVDLLVCPDCGYRPKDEERSGVTNLPRTYEEALDFFEVSGAPTGFVLCPECASHVRTGKRLIS